MARALPSTGIFAIEDHQAVKLEVNKLVIWFQIGRYQLFTR
jgi:hypothetical protein